MCFANRIEPSAEPGVFFGYNNITGSGDFRKYQLGATGITVFETKQGLVEKQKDDIHSDGNMVFSNTGIVVDGQKMDRVDFLPFGSIHRVNRNGEMCPLRERRIRRGGE